KLVWADSFVEEANLSVKMSALRKALDESPGETQFIETVPKRGYRFIAAVNEVNNSSSDVIQTEEKISRDNETAAESSSTKKALRAKSVRAEAPVLDPKDSLVEKKSHEFGLAFVFAILLIVLVVIGYGLYTFNKRNPLASFQAMKMTPLTTIGKIVQAVISPDGKYVVYAIGEAGQQSLWVRQLATGSNVQIIPPADVGYFGLTFSQDGNYIYYVLNESNYPMRYLYRIPVLGGVAKKVVTDVDSPIAFSPDGKWIAFQRFSPPEKLSALVIANADGSGEQRLATRNGADQFSEEGSAWSLDGKFIVSAVENHDAAGHYMSVVRVQVEDGTEKPITSKRWSKIGRVAWLQDGSGFLTTASEQVS